MYKVRKSKDYKYFNLYQHLIVMIQQQGKKFKILQQSKKLKRFQLKIKLE